MWEVALPLTAAGSGAAWAQLAAWRAGERTGRLALRSLLGGAAACGLALVAYEVAARLGLDVSWERMARGDTTALLVAAAAALMEEAAKLTGILLVIETRVRTRTALAVTFGVAAGFSALEALVVLHGDRSTIALARAALAPLAHALIAVPLAYGAAEWLRRPRSIRPLLQALLASVVIHAAGNLSLAIPWIGHAGYALSLAAPALVLFVRSRRHLRAAAPAISPVPPRMERVRSLGGP
jgi:RsiW-degrading membrane proteinase PrsW (M82 family)